MKKGPYKMKYTNGKKADASAFPFKASPAKVQMYEGRPLMPGVGMGREIDMPTTDKGHTHTQDFIVDGGETSSSSLDTV